MTGEPEVERVSRGWIWVRRILFGIGALSLIVIAVGYRSYREANDPPPPPPEELADVVIELGAEPTVSDALTGKVDKLSVKETRFAVTKDDAYAWSKTAAADLAAFDTDSLNGVRTRFFAPGCPPLPDPLDLENTRDVDGFIRHTATVLGLEAVLLAHVGDVATAQRGLVAVVDRLLDIEQKCAPDMIMVLTVMDTIGRLHGMSRWLLSHRDLGDEDRRGLWRWLHQLETRPTALTSGFRREILTFKAVVGREVTAEGYYFDREATAALASTHFKRAMWVAAKPAHEADLGKTYPEEEWLERIKEQPRRLALFRRNTIGITLAAIAFGPRKMIGAWHQAQCVLAARRRAWGDALAERGHAMKDVAPAPINPWTNAPFNDDGQIAQCRARGVDGVAEPSLPLAELPPLGPPLVEPKKHDASGERDALR